ncbi:hypothetical protein PHET_06370 [Paragonimus heterotremus]|uniref:Uncharacterized protein n=1 Tax=Paragonimus heterotremus TaxID=100268 RepID=A0A8J4T777_9TREM|nr:hypothetical protein PHET_06370 [Paragonimus heterotremus]
MLHPTGGLCRKTNASTPVLPDVVCYIVISMFLFIFGTIQSRNRTQLKASISDEDISTVWRQFCIELHYRS